MKRAISTKNKSLHGQYSRRHADFEFYFSLARATPGPALSDPHDLLSLDPNLEFYVPPAHLTQF